MRVLFLGNSYTYYNDLPGLLRTLAKSAGIALETEENTHGGLSLGGQCNGGRAVELIRAGGWDAVVMQDQSLRPVHAPALTRIAARQLQREVARVGARTVFYATWARQAQPEQQAALDHTYYRIARELEAEVGPVGDAWARVRQEVGGPPVTLYLPDGSHPAPAGTYLAAAVLFYRLTGRNPLGLAPLRVRVCGYGQESTVDLEPQAAAFLQRVAWQSVEAAPAPREWPDDARFDRRLEADPDVALLQEVPLLWGLGVDDVSALLRVTPRRRVAAGTPLYAAGQAGGAAFILLAGSVALEPRTGQHSQHDPRRLGLALTLGREGVRGGPYDATATTMTDAIVVRVGKGEIATLRERAPAAAERIAANAGTIA